MAVFLHELKSNSKMLLVWGISVGALIFLMMLMFPSMRDTLTEAVSGGVYSSLPKTILDAFGMNLSLSTASGFYGVEAGFMLSLGGALFGAFLGSSMLSKEESGHTAEFLFTTPVGRIRTIAEKLLAVVVLVLTFNLICLAFAVSSFVVIGESFTGLGLWLYHLAQACMHLQIAFICFALSATMRRTNVGIGLGVALILYFLPFFSEVNDKMRFLNYLSPFGYSNAGVVIANEAINGTKLAIGAAVGVASILCAFIVYSKKDLAS